MTDSNFAIQTRQKEGDLYHSYSNLLAAGHILASPVFETDGYSAISVFIVSDQPFQLRVLESVLASGPFSETQVLSSSLDATTGLQKLIAKISPSGVFMKVFLDNTGGDEKLLQVLISGLPLGGGAISSGGSTGLPGPTGIAGPTGPAGLQGVTGAGIQGVTGLMGPTGIQGATGAGIQGVTGLIGPTGIQGQTGVGGLTGIQGITGVPIFPTYVFTSPDTLSTADNVLIPWIPGRNFPVDSATAQVKTAPTGADITIDIVRIDRATGATIATIGTVTIAAGTLEGTTSFASIVIPDTEAVAAVITQVGSTIPGSNLTVEVYTA